jgi:hypothetical protein
VGNYAVQGGGEKMIFGEYESKLMIFLESAVIVLSMLLFVGYNYDFAHFVCNKQNIPFDFTLTMTSAGFGYNIIIILTVIELIAIVSIIEKLIPNFCRFLVWR